MPVTNVVTGSHKGGNIENDRLVEEVKQASLEEKKEIFEEALKTAFGAGDASELLSHVVGSAPREAQKSAVVGAVKNSHDAFAKELMTEAVDAAPADATKAAMARAVRTADRGDAQDLVTQAIDAATTNTAKAAVEEAKISQDTLDQIWLLIVKTFAYVLGGATVGLFLIVILDVFYPVELAHVQMMLTIFTTVAGILAGFITGQAVGTAKEKSRAKE